MNTVRYINHNPEGHALSRFVADSDSNYTFPNPVRSSDIVELVSSILDRSSMHRNSITH